MEIRKSDYENYDYREFWEDNKRLYEDSSERIAIKNLLKNVKRDKKLFMDLGCGYCRLFTEYKDYERIILVDYSMNNLRIAKGTIKNFLTFNEKKLASISFIAADVTNLPFKESCADIILTVRVIHHLSEPGKYFDEVKRVLKNNGLFFLEFANKRNLKNIFKFITWKIKTSPFSSAPYKIGGTILNFHPKYIMKILHERGFEVEKKVNVSNFRIGFLKRHIKPGILLFFEKLYQKLFSLVALSPSIFLKNIIIKKNTRELYRSIELMDILTCPVCKKGDISFKDDNTLKCSICNRVFKIEDGIFNFKLDN